MFTDPIEILNVPFYQTEFQFEPEMAMTKETIMA